MHNSSLMFSILITLLNNGKTTKKALAEKFEICERTVIRYINAIAATGVPVYSVKGKNGGYEISSEFQFDKSFFRSRKSRASSPVLNRWTDTTTNLTRVSPTN